MVVTITPIISPGLGDSASLKQVEEQHDDRDDQEHVDEIARDAEPESQSPHQQYDQQKGPQHKSPQKAEESNDTEAKKADVAEHPKVFHHVGLLVNGPPGT